MLGVDDLYFEERSGWFGKPNDTMDRLKWFFFGVEKVLERKIEHFLE